VVIEYVAETDDFELGDATYSAAILRQGAPTVLAARDRSGLMSYGSASYPSANPFRLTGRLMPSPGD
jgi:hypothetical protein